MSRVPLISGFLRQGAMRTLIVEGGELQWRIRTWGNPESPAVILLHGFTWDGASWGPVAERLSERFYCVAPDLPGHGATSRPEPTEAWSFDRVVTALADALAQLDLTDPHLVGYSMGGRLALRLAVMRALPLGRLVLVGASPGLETLEERLSRARSDAELAERLVQEGMQAFLERWMALPLFESMRAIEPARLASLNAGRSAQDPAGLASSLATTGAGSQPYLMEALTRVAVPTLLVVGDQDAKFRAIAEEMLSRLSHGRMEVVTGCGHSVPFECPEALAELVSSFFTQAPVAPASC